MTGDPCPISWLELELRALDELPAGERDRVDGHLDGCEVCRGRRDRIARDRRPMPPMRVSPSDGGDR